MPGTVKSGLLSDADRPRKCDCQEVCWMRHLLLDKGHFITEDGGILALSVKDIPVTAGIREYVCCQRGSTEYHDLGIRQLDN